MKVGRLADNIHPVTASEYVCIAALPTVEAVVTRAASTTGEFTKTAEAQMSELQKSFASLVDSSLKNAPAGSEQAVTLVRSAMTAANNAYESVHKAAKQAADIAEALPVSDP